MPGLVSTGACPTDWVPASIRVYRLPLSESYRPTLLGAIPGVGQWRDEQRMSLGGTIYRVSHKGSYLCTKINYWMDQNLDSSPTSQ